MDPLVGARALPRGSAPTLSRSTVTRLGGSEATQHRQTDGRWWWWLEPFQEVDGVGSGGGEGGESRALILGLGFEISFDSSFDFGLNRVPFISFLMLPGIKGFAMASA
jgi:hypothetical protein